MKAFFSILKARNIEYYRDKGSMAWSFLFPLLVIIGCAVAFSNPDLSVFKVGVLNADRASAEQQNWLAQTFIATTNFDDSQKALSRVQHHQIDLLIEYGDSSQYWINKQSSRGEAIEQLFLPAHPQFKKQSLSGRAVRYVDWVIPGVLGMNLMFGALFGVGYVIVRYRRNGVLKRMQATPVSAMQFIGAQLTSRLIIVVTVNALIFIGCDLSLDLIVLGSYFNLLLITTLGALAMIAIGLLVSCRTANEELAGGLLNLATWPMLFLSEVWFTLDDAPPWMRALAELMPLTHIVKANRAVMIDGATLAEVSYHLAWLVAISAVTLMAAAKWFRWTKQ